MAEGALEEVTALTARDLAPDLPVMKAVGVPELQALLKGQLARDEAIARAQRNSRRYAKRQYTWFRNRPPGGTAHWVLDQPLTRVNIDDFVRIIQISLLT